MQADLFDDFHTTRPLLQALWHLDKQRLLAWVAVQQQQAPGHQHAGDPAAGMLSTQQLYALFELLGYSHYLDDAELCAAAVGLLQHVGWALETSEGTPYAGLFRLLAHPDGVVRSKVEDAITAQQRSMFTDTGQPASNGTPLSTLVPSCSALPASRQQREAVCCVYSRVDYVPVVSLRVLHAPAGTVSCQAHGSSGRH
jgi:hypothetical protein